MSAFEIDCQCPNCSFMLTFLCKDRDGNPLVGCTVCGATYRAENVSVKLTVLQPGQKVAKND